VIASGPSRRPGWAIFEESGHDLFLEDGKSVGVAEETGHIDEQIAEEGFHFLGAFRDVPVAGMLPGFCYTIQCAVPAPLRLSSSAASRSAGQWGGTPHIGAFEVV
jgi:hypothetical protein